MKYATNNRKETILSTEQSCLIQVYNIIKSPSFTGFHILSADDIAQIKYLMQTARPTDAPNGHKSFPDFKCDAGFIEHFAVTSGIIFKDKTNNSHGYNNAKIAGQIYSQQEEDISKQFNECSDAHQLTAFRSAFFERRTNNESLQNFQDSFKIAWDKHINNYNKYLMLHEVVPYPACFMVESDDILSVHVEPKPNTKISSNKMPHCDLVDYLYRGTPFYLCYDVEILNYIYKFHDQIDYCVFVSGHGDIDVIKLASIPSIIELLSTYNIAIMPGYGLQVCSTIGQIST